MKIWLTGCTSGLGKALASEFTKAGHTIVGGGRRQDRLDELTTEFPNSHFLQLDVADESSAQAFCAAAFEATGAPDFLINNAAIINPPRPLWEIPASEFDQLTAININGVANMIRQVAPLMIEAGKGMIVNISSGWGRSTAPEVAPYCASKWAVEGLSQALSQELPLGVGTVALNPGIINTEMLQSAFGPSANEFPSPQQWAQVAAPYILNITPAVNGSALTVGE